MSTGIPGVDLFAVTVNGYIWFASYTIVLYDYACTIETEVKHVWSCPWSIGLVLFYFNRYLPFVDIIIYVRATLYPMPSPTDCLWIYPLIIWFTTIGLLISETIILLRTYAIWGRRLLMYWIVLFIVIGIFGSMLALISWKTAIDFKKNTLSIGSIPPDQFNCQATTFFSFNSQSTLCLLFFYLFVFLGEAIIMTLTIIRAREHVPRASVLWITQLYKNGIIYCACMLGLSLLNFAMILFAPAVYKPVFLPVERALHSVFGNWVVFLVLKNRQSRSAENGENNHPITTYAGSTMDVFTSVFPDTNDGGFDLSHGSSWQERADREWVR